MKYLNVVVSLTCVMTFASSQAFAANTCDSVFTKSSSEVTIKKALYLSMTKYEKMNLLMLQFGIAPRGLRGLVYDNLEVTPAFKMAGADHSGISFKLYSAARKALKQYEVDTRENGQTLRASVLFENAHVSITGEENPWAIMLSRSRISARSGEIILEPVALYSIERLSTGEKMVRIGSQFEGPLL